MKRKLTQTQIIQLTNDFDTQIKNCEEFIKTGGAESVWKSVVIMTKEQSIQGANRIINHAKEQIKELNNSVPFIEFNTNINQIVY